MSSAKPARPRQIKHRIVRDLLASARERLENEIGRPRSTVLRRVVSDAYYAVFHAICYVAADGTVGWSAPWQSFELLYRSIDHQESKRRLEAGDIRSLSPEVKRIGEIFGDLMKERHRADYDPRPFARSKSDVLLVVALAEEAVSLVEGLPDESYRQLAVHLIAKPRRS